jgi:hypothetical protein
MSIPGCACASPSASPSPSPSASARGATGGASSGGHRGMIRIRIMLLSLVVWACIASQPAAAAAEAECVIGDDGTCAAPPEVFDCVDSHESCSFWQEKGEVSVGVGVVLQQQTWQSTAGWLVHVSIVFLCFFIHLFMFFYYFFICCSSFLFHGHSYGHSYCCC